MEYQQLVGSLIAKIMLCSKRDLTIRSCLKKSTTTYLVEGTYELTPTQGARSAYSLRNVAGDKWGGDRVRWRE